MQQHELIRKIHASSYRLAMAVTGGGSLTISELLLVPGASGTVLEAVVPYANTALADYLGAVPERYCDEATARNMAMRAFQRAISLADRDDANSSPSTPHLLGVGCTASLASDRPKRGEHRAHIAIQSAARTQVSTVYLAKGVRDRMGEERLVADVMLAKIAHACQIGAAIASGCHEDWQMIEQSAEALPAWRAVVLGETRAVSVSESSQLAPRIVFPGAFHPLHSGHRRMADIAQRRLSAPVAFEITVANVDKPPLDYIDLQQRLLQFAPGDQLWLTRTPTFVEKSEVFPRATFVVGADTIRRIGEPRYYGNDPAACRAALQLLGQRGCRFLVFGRLADGTFRTLSELNLPKELRELCDEVPADIFREDISSTELRLADRDQPGPPSDESLGCASSRRI